MGKQKKGSAYIMVVFVSFPILLAALAALAVSINSRNISARHSDFFGMYEFASAANMFAMVALEEAYMAYREAAHSMALLQFEEMHYDYYEEGVIHLAEYAWHFRNYLIPMIWTHLEGLYGKGENVINWQFEIILGTDHVFYGTMRITRESDRIYFWSQVTKESDNIVPIRDTVQGIVGWPTPAEKEFPLYAAYQIKNLDYFTPWVVELMKH